MLNRIIDWSLENRSLVLIGALLMVVAGGLALMLWAMMIMSGRMIAYDWFDCGRQPQPAIVNALAGCVTDARPGR